MVGHLARLILFVLPTCVLVVSRRGYASLLQIYQPIVAVALALSFMSKLIKL